MGTPIRPEISSKNKYYISKHRYFELYHFCLQYSEWQHDYIDLKNDCLPLGMVYGDKIKSSDICDRTQDMAVRMSELDSNMKMIKDTCEEADKDISKFLFKAVTEGLSYTTLFTKYNIPCGKDYYYDRYRRFFWMLSQKR